MVVCLVLLMILASKIGGSALRVLALHGSGGSPSKFDRALTCFREILPAGSVIDFLQGPFGKDDGFCWWNMDDGERSFNARELQGLETSFDRVIARIKETRPDILLGHSQGAMMAAIVLAKSITEKDSNLVLPKIAILSGSSYPMSQKELFEMAKSSECPVKTVHCIGRADNINPPELAHQLASTFKGSIVLEHGGGHVFPQDEFCLNTYRRELIGLS